MAYSDIKCVSEAYKYLTLLLLFTSHCICNLLQQPLPQLQILNFHSQMFTNVSSAGITEFLGVTAFPTATTPLMSQCGDKHILLFVKRTKILYSFT